MDSICEIEHINKFPTSNNTWEEKKTKIKTEFEVRKFQAGDVFGHQEIFEFEIEKFKELEDPSKPPSEPIMRKCRVRTLDEDCEVYYVNSNDFNKINCK